MTTFPQHLALVSFVSVTSLSLVARAQAPSETPPPPPALPEGRPAEPAGEVTPPGSEAPAAEAAPAPTPEERLTAIEGQLEGLTETSAATVSTVGKLNKIKLSGYVQGRYEWHDDAKFGVNASNAPTGTNRFLVRRARLKTAYAGELSEYVFQIDATGAGVALRDAEASLVLNNENMAPHGLVSETAFELKLTVGQFKIPFGYEVLQSSGDREMPERTKVVSGLFPGERDRGLRLQARYGMFRLNSAIINGNFTNDPIYGVHDQTSFKDVVGRAGADLGMIVFGVSGHWGHTLKTTLPRAASGTTPAVALSYQRFRRVRVGGDAQVYLDVPSVGGLTLRGEVIWAKDKNIEFSGMPPDACRDVTSFGWYGTLVQNIGDRLGAVLRYEQYDPNTGVGATCAATLKTAVGEDKVSIVGGGLLLHFSGNLKGTLAYEHLTEQGAKKVDNDIFTAQLQSKF